MNFYEGPGNLSPMTIWQSLVRDAMNGLVYLDDKLDQ